MTPLRLRRFLDALTHTGPGYDTRDTVWARAYGEEIAALKAAHEAHRTALAEGLGLDASAPWEAITKHITRADKRVRELRAESLRRGKEVVARNDRIAGLERRAEQAEAAITRVRAVAGWAINGWSDIDGEKVLAALDGIAPAGPEQPPATSEVPDEHAEPQTWPVLDALVHDVFAAFRRAFLTPRDPS